MILSYIINDHNSDDNNNNDDDNFGYNCKFEFKWNCKMKYIIILLNIRAK